MTLTYQTYSPYSMPPYKVFKHFAFVIALWLCSNATYAADNKPQENELVVTPNRCVALRQGQVCYQEVTFTWRQPKVADYCLLELSTLDKVKCWSQVKSGELSFDFQSDRSLTYVLRKKTEQTDLSSASITVSWVFKSSKRPKSSWKLF